MINTISSEIQHKIKFQEYHKSSAVSAKEERNATSNVIMVVQCSTKCDIMLYIFCLRNRMKKEMCYFFYRTHSAANYLNVPSNV